MTVKVCGMTDLDNLQSIASANPDYFGFIFYDKSPRELKIKTLPNFNSTKKIGVFVDAPCDIISKYQQDYKLDGVQLHGKEDENYVKKLKTQLPNEIKVLKAISVIEASDFHSIKQYEGLVDLIILDTKSELRGGSGKQFDWNLLEYYTTTLPFLLSGGISADDADEVLKLEQKYPQMKGVDINSKFELKPGLKAVNKVSRFINTLKP